jgi:hypothetical protein
MTYPKFEEIWQSKFQNAQENPSEAIWEAIAWQIGYKERQRKKWIAWWAAALISFFLGDGRLVYNFYGKFFESQAQQSILEVSTNTAPIKENTDIHSKVSKNRERTYSNSIAQTEQKANHSVLPILAEAAFELAEEKVAAKTSEEATAQEALGKPKKRAFWLKTYANTQQVKPDFAYTPKLPAASRMIPNLQSVQKEQNLQKEISSFKHIFTWGVGMEVGWQFHKNFYVSSGLHWQRSLFAFQSKSKIPELAQFWGRVPENTQSFSRPQTPMVEAIIKEEDAVAAMAEPIAPIYQFEQKMDYLTMPIKIGYQQIKHRWQYGVAMGIENSFLLNNTFRGADEEFSGVYEFTNRWQAAALAEISVGVRLNHKITLLMNPSFRQFLDNPLGKSSLQFNSKGLGIGAGLQISL